MGRALGIDYGERRIGLAIGDPTSTLAQPIPALTRRRGKRPPVRQLMELMVQHGIDRSVVGLPLSLDGTDSEWTTEVRSFAGRLQERARVPVFLIDERMTSVLAERAVRALGLPKSQRERKDRIDTAAAQLILQAFLDHERRGLPLLRAAPVTTDDADHAD